MKSHLIAVSAAVIFVFGCSKAEGIGCFDLAQAILDRPEDGVVLGQGEAGVARLAHDPAQGLVVVKTYRHEAQRQNDLRALDLIDHLDQANVGRGVRTARRFDSSISGRITLEYIRGRALEHELAGARNAELSGLYEAFLWNFGLKLAKQSDVFIERTEIYRLPGSRHPRLSARVRWQGYQVRILIKPDNIIVSGSTLVIVDPH